MAFLHEQLCQLVTQTCQHPPGSKARQQGLTQIIRLITRSGKLWRENTPNYEEAWQKTWLFFCLNLCEATTGNKYDPSKATVITWLNFYLKMRLKDSRIHQNEKQKRVVSHQITLEGETLDLLDTLEAPPDPPPILSAVQNWAESDPTGELQQKHLRGHPEITVQLLILRRLPPETPWKDLAEEFGVNVSSLSMFYERQCRPRLRAFGETQGFLEKNTH